MRQVISLPTWFCLLPFFLITACGCPDDVPLGDLFLDADMRTHISYQGDETLLFVNQSGDTLLFQSYQGLEEDSIHLNVAQQCAKDLFDVQHLFYHSNEFSIRFENLQDPGKAMTLRWHLVPIDTAGDPAVPAHLVGYMTVDSWVMDYGMKVIVDDRGAVLPPEAAYYQHARLVADTTLGNRSFQGLYYTQGGSQSGESSIFYHPRRGVVALQEANGPLWVLDTHPSPSFQLGHEPGPPSLTEVNVGRLAIK
jgi:hypothetical protein